MSAIEIQIRLHQLHVERALAAAEGLATDAAYSADLEEEIAASHEAYVAAAVSEIAALRAELSGPLVG
jgi:hypothetical protein